MPTCDGRSGSPAVGGEERLPGRHDSSLTRREAGSSGSLAESPPGLCLPSPPPITPHPRDWGSKYFPHLPSSYEGPGDPVQ